MEEAMRTLRKGISLIGCLRRALPSVRSDGGRLAAAATLLLAATFATAAPADAAMVYLKFDRANPQASYAAGRLRAALLQKSHTIAASAARSDFRITLAETPGKLGAEAYALAPQPASLVISGGDGRGLIYGTLDVVEQLENGTALAAVQKSQEAPALPFRAIKFNFPWDSYRASATIDQHHDTVRDVKFWQAFLDMMVENRFNAITLGTLHPWQYMIRTKNFPEANPFTEEQLAEWRTLHRAIFRMAKERGIDTYLLPWNIFVSKEFVKAHNVAQANTYPNYNTTGDRSEIVKRYVRESAAQVLAEYPDLTGMGIVMGEAMGGMTIPEKVAWMNDTYLAAIRDAKRPVKLLWNLSSVDSREEELTLRKAIEAVNFVEGPIWVGLKFNWSHALSTPTLAQIHGGKLGDTYFTPEPKNYKIEWIARNEDVFALRWGVPSFVRQHVRANGTAPYIGGYTVGSETYIPAVDYFTAVQQGADWRYAFERQWLFYKLWGRLLYNPGTPDSVFAAEFTRRYGARGRDLLQAYELASATPLRLASLFYSTWDHTLYSEGMMWLKGRSMAKIGADDLITQAVLDPAYVSIADYVAATLKGQGFAADRVTPPALASRLETDSREALRLVEGIDTSGSTALMYEVADVKTWAHLGLHLAEQIRGATALQTYRKAGGAKNRTQAISHLENALAEWDKVIAITRPIYRDMLLVHFTGNSKALNPDAEFHWARLRLQVVEDIQAARNAKTEVQARTSGSTSVAPVGWKPLSDGSRAAGDAMTKHRDAIYGALSVAERHLLGDASCSWKGERWCIADRHSLMANGSS
jgi:hypothetical protein